LNERLIPSQALTKPVLWHVPHGAQWYPPPSADSRRGVSELGGPDWNGPARPPEPSQAPTVVWPVVMDVSVFSAEAMTSSVTTAGAPVELVRMKASVNV
jgi:hypothetical protein